MQVKINITKLVFSVALIFPNGMKAGNPNIVFILVDDLGWTDLSVSGSDYYQTPNVDQLAKEGMMFTNAYSACTVSSPTRASILTGKYPAKLHLTDWIEGWKADNTKLQIPQWTMYLPQEEVTLAEIFRDAGYRTGHFGKWHLGKDEKYWPENQGFEVNVGGWAKGSPNRDKAENYSGYFSPYGNPRLTDGKDGEYLTERLTNEACSFIERYQKESFFLNFWLYNVHTPLQAEKEKIDKYKVLQDTAKRHKNPTYAAMVEHMDDAVGKLVKKLKKLNLYDNTIIVFTSDNGGLIGGGIEKVTNNSPLRRGKGDKYEGGVRVPLIIKDKAGKINKRIESTPVISVDFLPTLVEISGISFDKTVLKNVDGISLKPLLQKSNGKIRRNSIYWHYPHYHREGATPYSALRNDNWKLIHIMETDSYELYNLATDIGEKNNLTATHPKMTKRLTRELENWKKKMNAQMPVKK